MIVGMKITHVLVFTFSFPFTGVLYLCLQWDNPHFTLRSSNRTWIWTVHEAWDPQPRGPSSVYSAPRWHQNYHASELTARTLFLTTKRQHAAKSHFQQLHFGSNAKLPNFFLGLVTISYLKLYWGVYSKLILHFMVTLTIKIH